MLRRCLRALLLAAVMLPGAAGGARAAEPGAGRGAAGPGEPLDAEMLRDLDVLGSPDYIRDREIARRLRILERLRMLEALRALEDPGPPAAATGAPTAKEVR